MTKGQNVLVEARLPCHRGELSRQDYPEVPEARFISRISAVSNAIETIDNEIICFIIFCLNCNRHG